MVWDNNDANVETLDRKGTLHTNMGLAYQNQVDDFVERHVLQWEKVATIRRKTAIYPAFPHKLEDSSIRECRHDAPYND